MKKLIVLMVALAMVFALVGCNRTKGKAEPEAAATDRLSEDPQFFCIDSHEIAIWKSRGKISVMINRCPHMGAPLSEGTVQDGVLSCPWHGVHLHPHSFARLKVIGNVDEVLTVRVVFRAFGSFGVEVDCTFHCPEPNTIVMTIIDGEGKGSVVETHATSISPGWTMVTEATLATSDRRVFRRALRRPARMRAAIEKRAKRLWEEDRSYGERRYYLRHPELLPEMAAHSFSEPVGKPRPI